MQRILATAFVLQIAIMICSALFYVMLTGQCWLPEYLIGESTNGNPITGVVIIIPCIMMAAGTFVITAMIFDNMWSKQ